MKSVHPFSLINTECLRTQEGAMAPPLLNERNSSELSVSLERRRDINPGGGYVSLLLSLLD